MTDVPEPREMFESLPWPFEGGRFPADLGAVVQKSVLSGEQPAREIIHTPDNAWCIGDGINDPNPPGASIATHIWHAVDRNSSLAALAELPPGHLAVRDDPGDEWVVYELEGWDDDD